MIDLINQALILLSLLIVLLIPALIVIDGFKVRETKEEREYFDRFVKAAKKRSKERFIKKHLLSN